MKSSKTGLPLMRAMFIEYPEDENCRDISDQYMFGDSFLVAPILEERWTGRNVYLPHGKWIDFWDGSLIEGGKEIYVGAPIEKIPVFVKYGSVIPMNLNDHFKVGGSITDPSRHYENFCLCVYGDHINNYEFEDDHCNRLLLSTEDEKIIIEMNWEPQPAIRTNVGNAEIFINGVKTKTERLTSGDNYVYKPKQSETKGVKLKKE